MVSLPGEERFRSYKFILADSLMSQLLSLPFITGWLPILLFNLDIVHIAGCEQGMASDVTKERDDKDASPHYCTICDIHYATDNVSLHSNIYSEFGTHRN